MVRILLIMAALAGGAVAPALSDERVVELEAWRFALPGTFEFEKTSGGQRTVFRTVVAGTYHTLIVAAEAQSFPWDAALPPESKGVPLTERSRRRLLAAIVTVTANIMIEDSELTVRHRNFSAELDEGDVLPREDLCELVRWQVEDVGVPGHEGVVFIMRGLDLFCTDFAEGGKTFDFIDLHISERYSATLGHTPLASLDDLARSLFGSLLYRHGPRHESRDGGAGKAPTPEMSALIADPFCTGQRIAARTCANLRQYPDRIGRAHSLSDSRITRTAR